VRLGLAQLPVAEWTGFRPGTYGLRKVVGFAAWRSAHAGLRPLALLIARLLVLHLISAAAVGRLEAARLLVAPAQTLINGAGSFLLSTFAETERAKDGGRAQRRRSRQQVGRAVWLLGAGTVATGLVSLLLFDQLTALVAGDEFDVSPVAFLGWTVYVATWAMTLPYVSETVARKLSREVFLIRVVDSVIGLALVAGVLIADRTAVNAVPWLLSVGGVVGAVLLRRLAVSSRRQLRQADLMAHYGASYSQ
jgi:O-antigen/teichoic acid export membrane protein